MFERAKDFYLRRPFGCGVAMLLGLVLLVYGDTLFWPSYRVISREGADLALGISGLDFIFGELRHGNFVLWCPFLLSGYSVFAAFQSLQLYPPSLLFLLFPAGPACNLFIMLHVWLMGIGMMWWLLRRGLHPLAALVSGALLMLGATTTMQAFAGHITPLAAMTWMPFILTALDGILQSGTSRQEKARWVLAGTVFVALQVAANFPQHVVYTALAAGLYFLIRIVAMKKSSLTQRLESLGAAALMYIWGALLLSVQLLTSLQVSKETARATAMRYPFISTYSFPPENFWTLFAPTFFGDEAHLTYWGRWSFEEATFFMGVAGLFLIGWGVWRSSHRVRWAWLGLSTLFVLIALGRYTPFHFWMYEFVPMFGSFRASSRALFEASVFLCALAGLGLDQLLRAPSSPHEKALRLKYSWLAIGAAVAIFMIVLWLLSAGTSPLWQGWMESIGRSRETYVKLPTYLNQGAVTSMANLAAISLLVSASTCMVVATLFRQAGNARTVVHLLALVAVLEIAGFARYVRPDFDRRNVSQPKTAQFLAAHPGDYRIIKDNFSNLSLSWRVSNVGGYESFRFQRYDEFIHWTQGRSPDTTAAVLTVDKYNPLYAMLRVRYIFEGNSTTPQIAPERPLPHALLVYNYRVLKNRDNIFRAMGEKSFDPRKEVILESKPNVLPEQSTQPGTATVKIIDTDTLEIEAETQSPAILLITDSYSKFWQATAMPGSSQTEYSVMPANYVLRAIPIEAGKHRIRLEYLPSGFVIGKWISIGAWLMFVSASLATCFRTRRRHK